EAAVDGADDLLRRVEAAAGGAVVLAAGLEADALEGPAHRPVDAPGQLDVAALAQIDPGRRAAVAAVELDAPLAVPGEVDAVAPAGAAEPGERKPALGQRLAAELVEDDAD